MPRIDRCQVKRTFVFRSFVITYEEIGSAPNTVVLVHGAGANRNYWKGLTEHLRSYRVLAPDLYGHGDTPIWASKNNTPYFYSSDVDLLEALIKLHGQPVHLVGHSSGGSVCIELAIKKPEFISGLVLIEPMLPTILRDKAPNEWEEISSTYKHCHSELDKGNTAVAAHDLFEYILGDGEWNKLPEKVRKWMVENIETLTAHSRASLALQCDLEAYGKLNVPVLTIHGSHSRTPYQKISQILAQTFRRSRVLTVKGSSHNSPLTHLGTVGPAILNFLEKSRL